jgi:hypothetical protein
MEASIGNVIFEFAQLNTSVDESRTCFAIVFFVHPLVVAISLTYLLSIHLSCRNDGLLAVARQLKSGRGLLVVVMMTMRLRSIGRGSREDGRESGSDSFDFSPWEGRGCDGAREYEECESHRYNGSSEHQGSVDSATALRRKTRSKKSVERCKGGSATVPGGRWYVCRSLHSASV